jgi:cytochrome c
MPRQALFIFVLLQLVPVLMASHLARAENGQQLPERLEGHGGPVKAIAISSDGTEALTGSFDYAVIHWSLSGEEGKIIARLVGHKAAVNGVAFVPGENRAVSVGDDGALAIWDLETGKLLKLIGDREVKVLGVAVSPDGRLAAAARWDNTVRLYDLEAMTETKVLEGHRANVNAVAFSPDGSTLYSASYDGTVRAWNPAIGGSRVVYSHGWGINVLAVLPDGRVAFGALDGTVGVIDPVSGVAKQVGSYDRPILSISDNPKQGLLAAGGGDGHIRVYDTETLLEVEDYGEPYGPVWALDFMPDGKNVFRGGLDDFAMRWQIEPREPFEKVVSTFPRRFQVDETSDPGQREFLRKCSICHTLTPDGGHRAGPTLYGLFGRKAGTVPAYPYSDALKSSGIIWTEKTVGRLFDDGPDIVVPGTKMPVQRLKAVTRRDALIAYLKRATDPSNSDVGTNR